MDNNPNSLRNDPRFKNTAITLVTILVVFFAVKTIGEVKGLSHIGKAEYPTNTITVSGKGEVLATPDIATFTFTVSEEDKDVGAAQKKATDKMNAILASLKGQGVDDKDVKTTSYNIYPRYDYVNATIYVPGKQVLAAYVVSQSVEVKVRALDTAGALLSGIGAQGVENVSGLAFSVDKQDEVLRDARAEAIKDARAQAKVLADSLGVDLGDIVSFSDNSGYTPYPVYYAKDSMMSAGAVMNQAAVPDLPSGENKITSNVSITYEVK